MGALISYLYNSVSESKTSIDSFQSYILKILLYILKKNRAFAYEFKLHKSLFFRWFELMFCSIDAVSDGICVFVYMHTLGIYI